MDSSQLELVRPQKANLEKVFVLGKLVRNINLVQEVNMVAGKENSRNHVLNAQCKFLGVFVLTNNSIEIHIRDTEERSGLSIDMSYCCLVNALTIRFNTPFGVISVIPEKYDDGWSPTIYSFDIDVIIEKIEEGLEKKLPTVSVGCSEPYFFIEIYTGPNGDGHDEDCYSFTMGLDVVALRTRSSTGGSDILINLFQTRKNIEDFVLFLRDIRQERVRKGLNDYAGWGDGSPLSFTEAE